ASGCDIRCGLALFAIVMTGCSTNHDCPPRLALIWGTSVCPDGANDEVTVMLPGKSFSFPCTISPSPHIDSTPWVGTQIVVTAQILSPSGSTLRTDTAPVDVFRSTPDDTGGCTNPLVELNFFPNGSPDGGALPARGHP